MIENDSISSNDSVESEGRFDVRRLQYDMKMIGRATRLTQLTPSVQTRIVD